MRKSWIAIGMSVLMTAVMLTGCGGSSACGAICSWKRSDELRYI